MPYSCAPFVHNSCSKKEFRKVGVRSTPYRLSPRPCREIFRHSSAVQSSCRLPVENLDSRETARKTGRQKRADTPPAVLDATLGHAASLGALDGRDTIVFVAIQGDHLHNVPPCGGPPLLRSSGILPPPEACFHTITPVSHVPSLERAFTPSLATTRWSDGCLTGTRRPKSKTHPGSHVGAGFEPAPTRRSSAISVNRV